MAWYMKKSGEILKVPRAKTHFQAWKYMVSHPHVQREVWADTKKDILKWAKKWNKSLYKKAMCKECARKNCKGCGFA